MLDSSWERVITQVENQKIKNFKPPLSRGQELGFFQRLRVNLIDEFQQLVMEFGR
jgi:hypothetical protein